MKFVRPIVVLLSLGWLWFVSGYMIYSYVVPSPTLAFGIFPVIYFGFKDCIKEASVMLLVIMLIVLGCYVSGQFFKNVLEFHGHWAYTLLPVVIVASVLVASVIFPYKNNSIGDGGNGFAEE